MTLPAALEDCDTKALTEDRTSRASAFKFQQSLKDYAEGALKLFWQRHAMYFGAFLLATAYYDGVVAVTCYWVILLSELFDHAISKRVQQWGERDARKAETYLKLMVFGTLINASSIGVFIVVATMMEGTSSHFTPLLFLFAAALFAAMNAHQVFLLLVIRLAIYALLFLFIALFNIIQTRPPISSIHWLHFFTVLFVLYFIVDCSIIFVRMYRRNLTQIEELRNEHERAMAAYHAKSQFLSVVSHELRTPITSIKGPLNLICSGALGPVPEAIEKMLTIANRNSERLAHLIDDLLDLQALDSGKMTMHLQPIKLSKLIRDAVEATAGYLREKNVSIKTGQMDEELCAWGDEKRLMQVMANLLSNAVKFSNENGVVEVTLGAAPNGARISVKDSGCGIPAESEEKVFGEFSQIDSTDMRSAGGTGLGLSISKRIVDRHSGAIAYESKLGVGTTFHVLLPLLGSVSPVGEP